MANVKLTWTLPTVRASGKPLDPADIAKVEIALSADGGATFTVSDEFPPSVLETQFLEMEPGTWQFRGVVVDKVDRRSSPVIRSVTVPDTTPPGPLTLEAVLF